MIVIWEITLTETGVINITIWPDPEMEDREKDPREAPDASATPKHVNSLTP